MAENATTFQISNQRLISLDAFRGLTIAAMILVNFPGNYDHVYAPLEHAAWNGLTPTDLIFPFFLFIVGVSIVLAYSKRIQAGAPGKGIYKKLVFRAFKIFMVGLLLNFVSVFNFHELRIAGVLQRIALVFLCCALLYLNTNWRTQAIVGAMILILYWLAMTLVPTPGYGVPMLQPGRNLAAWLDLKLLPGAMYRGTWDPEGILSTFPSIVTGILGMLAGTLIISKQSQERKVIWLFLFGFVATILGKVWSWDFPVNKNLWTSSFVLVAGGLASMTLAASMFVVDILGYVKGTKAGVIFGSNAITVYVLAGILSVFFYDIKYFGASLNLHFFNLFTGIDLDPRFVSMMYSLMYIGIIFIPAYILYKKQIFIKL